MKWKFSMLTTIGKLGFALAMATECSWCAQIFINFDELQAGQLAAQYSSQGVTFSPAPFVGNSGPTGSWATQVDLSIIAVADGDIDALGMPELVSGKIIRSLSGWFQEDGDPSVLITMSFPLQMFSIDFAGLDQPAATGILGYGLDKQSLIASAFASGTGQERLTLTGQGIYHIVVLPGSFEDWVSFDNLEFTLEENTVPEPKTFVLISSALILQFFLYRARNRSHR